MNVRKYLSVCAVVVAEMSLAACHNSGGSSDGSGETKSHGRAGDTPLHAAAARNDDQAVRDLIAQGTDPNVPGRHDNTPLAVAAADGQMRAATALLNAG